jgi:non-specific serine/threonine protein kinase
MYDPILLKLPLATHNTLRDLKINRLEQLFGLSKHQLLSMRGIGPTKCDEIQDLLYNLPLDYTNLEFNPFIEIDKQSDLGLDPELQNIVNRLAYDRYSKYISRGMEYFRDNRVEKIEPVPGIQNLFQGRINGSIPYIITIPLSGKRDNIECTCPYANGLNHEFFVCKHVVAAYLELAYQQRIRMFAKHIPIKKSYAKLQNVFEEVKRKPVFSFSNPLEYILVYNDRNWNLYPTDLYDRYGNYANSTNRKAYLYNYRYDDPWDRVTTSVSRDILIVDYLRQMYARLTHHQNSKINQKELRENLANVLDLLRGENIRLQFESLHPETVQVSRDAKQLSMVFQRRKSSDDNRMGFTVSFDVLDGETTIPLKQCTVITNNPCWLYNGHKVMEIDIIGLSVQDLISINNESPHVPFEDVAAFLESVFSVMFHCNIEPVFEPEIIEERVYDVVPRLYLSEKESKLLVTPRIAYNGFELNGVIISDSIYIPEISQINGETTVKIIKTPRDFGKEATYFERLEEANLSYIERLNALTPEFDPMHWLTNVLPELVQEGYEVFGENELKKFSRPRALTSTKFTVSSSENWFNLEGELVFENISISLNEIRSVLNPGSRYIRLPGNKSGELSAEWLERLKKLLKLSDSEKEQTLVPKIAATVLEDLLAEADMVEVDEAFDSYASRLRSFDKIQPVTVPDGFLGTLRSYQLAGLSWLAFLQEFGYGGILADDMGLGKTVQVLALLQKMKQSLGREPRVLIVAPRSVIQNWQAEAAHFVPDLSVHVHHGSDRSLLMELLPKTGVVVTTYNTLRIDLHLFNEMEFDIAVLDESHTIRNPSAKISKAVRLIRADNRLCLTGTPVQNSTMDLWAQFHFLNPGLLGNITSFTQKWVNSIEKFRDADSEQMLQKMVAPFILRRTKQKVANDLPPLTSSLVYCEMEKKQLAVYEKYRKVYYSLINKTIDEKGLRKSRFSLLEGLTRLRQICCSPVLVKAATTDSVKVARFLELAEELISEGHRALIFSQFVQFLKIIEKEVKKKKWSYEYLDGSTSNRQERVDHFQSDESVKLFLISLKAGGEGLNLTGADYVFIMDPWWNPAAERQAMDRTHRIGQKENVFVYRFICPETVEEKILRLQERKKVLSESLITAEAGIFKELSKEDLLSLFECR